MNLNANVANAKCQRGCPPDELIDILVEIREHYQKPLIINSGYRCKEHNKRVGGALKSRHLQGDASDFTIKDVPTIDVFKHVLSIYDNRPFGIALSINTQDKYRGFVHLDIRGYKARWAYNSNGAIMLAQIQKELGIA